MTHPNDFTQAIPALATLHPEVFIDEGGVSPFPPDDLFGDDAGVHWIVEGKQDVDMASPVVIAKRDAAAAWVKTVNSSDEVHETWAYLLASEPVCSAATSWEALKFGSQVFR